LGLIKLGDITKTQYSGSYSYSLQLTDEKQAYISIPLADFNNGSGGGTGGSLTNE
jgi:hypothetical protein